MLNTVISGCLKSDFKAFEKITDSIFNLRWGKRDEVEKVRVLNELTGEYEFTGEVRETNRCTYEVCRWHGAITPEKFMNEVRFKRTPTLSELNEILPETYNKFEVLKQYLLKSIQTYDKSNNVNQFYIGEYATWLDKATRVGLKLRFESELAQGMTDTVLWQDGISFPLNLQDAIAMLYAIEVYASACYDNTQKHITEVNKLETIEDLLAYDYTANYPEKLKFS